MEILNTEIKEYKHSTAIYTIKQDFLIDNFYKIRYNENLEHKFRRIAYINTLSGEYNMNTTSVYIKNKECKNGFLRISKDTRFQQTDSSRTWIH